MKPVSREPEVVIYPGAPLRAVAIEVGFAPPLLDAVSRFAAFQRRYLGDFAIVREVAEYEWEPDDGREFKRPRSTVLIDAEKQRAVTIAMDQLAVVTYPPYAGFSAFLAWALPMLIEGLRDIGANRLSRIAFRYENRIPHSREDLDLNALFSISLPRPSGALPAIRDVHLHWHQDWPQGMVEVSLDGACPAMRRELQLDIVASHDAQGMSLDDGLEALVREMHRRARHTFETLITDAFRNAIEKGPFDETAR